MNLQQERIEHLCRLLKLESVASQYPALAQEAAREELPYSDFLERLLDRETRLRQERTREVLLRMAGFPAIKTLEEYDFGFASGVPKS